ncbi:MAG: type II toxin-antitoxin system prevent-host-death family antitoxin [Nocardioides sp.]
MDMIGIRELRQAASQHLKAVAAGRTITITDRGVPVARLSPVSPAEVRLQEVLRTHGLLPPTRPRRGFSLDTLLVGHPLDLAEDRVDRNRFDVTSSR